MVTRRAPRAAAPRIGARRVAELCAELKLPSALEHEQPWQQVLWLALPRLFPMRLWRQVPGKHKVERGGVMRGAPPGAADLTGDVIGTGRRIELEVKFAGAPLRPAQRRWLTERAADGCVTVVVDYDPRADLAENLRVAAGLVAVALLTPPAADTPARALELVAGGRP